MNSVFSLESVLVRLEQKQLIDELVENDEYKITGVRRKGR